jgi:hypothetical protein
MAYSDPIPKPPSAELINSAQNLHDILADSFSRPFETLGYKANFDIFIPSQSVFDTEQAKKAMKRLIAEPIHKDRAWNIEIGYNPSDENLAITSLTIPFQPTNNTYHDLIMRRLDSASFVGDYAVLERTAPDAEPTLYKSEVELLEKAVFDNDTICMIPESDVLQLAHMAGYTHPLLFDKPDDLLIHMAETLGTAYRWHRTESITIPLSEGYQLLLRRGASIIEPEISGQRGDGWLEAIIESVGKTRKQTVIRFDYEDHFIKLPTITTQEITPATDEATIANYGPDANTVKNKDTVTTTAEMFDLLAESLMDELGDQ